MVYKEVVIRKGGLISKALKEVQDTDPKRGKKVFARKKIHEEIFDTMDAVADNSKMISLMLSLLIRVYDIIPNDQKDDLSEEDKGLIEYTFNKFNDTTTLADNQLKKEGTQMVDTILDRQAEIAKIYLK